MEYFIGEIIPFAGQFVPEGTLECAGQLLPIQGNEALFSLIGTRFGGNGSTNFALPDLRGRLAMGTSTTTTVGTVVGALNVALSADNLPAHNHTLSGTTAQATGTGITNGSALANTPANILPYADITKPILNTRALNAKAVGVSGGSQPHSNVMPTACIRYCMCVQGIYPSLQD